MNLRSRPMSRGRSRSPSPGPEERSRCETDQKRGPSGPGDVLNTFICDECCRSFLESDDYFRHRGRCPPETYLDYNPDTYKWQCKVCHLTGKLRGNFTRHFMFIHANDDLRRCSICKIRVIKESSLWDHYRKKHAGHPITNNSTLPAREGSHLEAVIDAGASTTWQLEAAEREELDFETWQQITANAMRLAEEFTESRNLGTPTQNGVPLSGDNLDLLNAFYNQSTINPNIITSTQGREHLLYTTEGRAKTPSNQSTLSGHTPATTRCTKNLIYNDEGRVMTPSNQSTISVYTDSPTQEGEQSFYIYEDSGDSTPGQQE